MAEFFDWFLSREFRSERSASSMRNFLHECSGIEGYVRTFFFSYFYLFLGFTIFFIILFGGVFSLLSSSAFSWLLLPIFAKRSWETRKWLVIYVGRSLHDLQNVLSRSRICARARWCFFRVPRVGGICWACFSWNERFWENRMQVQFVNVNNTRVKKRVAAIFILKLLSWNLKMHVTS